MSLGPAGTGKSFLAVSVAITLLMEKIDRVILSRQQLKPVKTWLYLGT